jgi:hypothetical protein
LFGEVVGRDSDFTLLALITKKQPDATYLIHKLKADKL